MTERPASPWMDAHEVADRLRLKPKTVHNMTGPNAQNPIPFHRLSAGGEKRFHVEEVDEWLRGR
jgi:excisionase family DNA binding protein